MADLYGIGGAVASGMINFGLSAYNNEQARQLAAEDRQQNYLYGEMTANNADRRTRALYNSFYSPEALLKQYHEAGLSPSMMFGGTPGQGGMSGAQGSGSNGLQTPYMPVSLLEAAQAAQLIAQTDKTKAETASIKTETDIKELVKEIQELQKTSFKETWELLNAHHLTKADGTSYSLFELANDCNSVEEYFNKLDELGLKPDNENKNKILREIYSTAHEFNKNIAVFDSENTNAKFTQSIVEWLKNNDYEKMNAEAIKKSLETSISTDELTIEQNKSWKHLLDGIEHLGGEAAEDTTIIMAIILKSILGSSIGQAAIKGVTKVL